MNTSLTKTSGAVDSSEGLPIYYDLYVPDENSGQPLPVILFLHGFKGFKNWGAFPDACEELSRAGFAVLAMNFSLNGVGKNMLEFDELELFARETLSQDLDDVGTVIKALKSGTISADNTAIDSSRIGLLGHSRGGHTAVAAADENAEVKCLVTWSAVADYNARWSQEMIEDWESKGVTEIKNGRTGQIMPVKKVVYEDALEHADRLMAVRRIKNIHSPVLIVHAEDDEGVSPEEAQALFTACPSAIKELKLVPDTGHTFGSAHPFEGEELPQPFGVVVDYTAQWFSRYLQ